MERFCREIYRRYRENPRPMPWRQTRDPYRILVSEIMLQQTQVSRVLVKYEQFLTAFPTIAALAAAPLPELLEVWSGLGYNRRALALKRCADQVMTDCGGHLPNSIEELESLPGIGPYTARAVGAFAFGIATPLIETNVRSVFIHFFFQGCETVTDRQIMPLVSATLDRHNPREWYYALMDYGAFLKQQYPNPSRRSRHHVQQSRFEGSNRQLRSHILQSVLAHPGITVPQLLELLACDRTALKKNLIAMSKEGFLGRSGDGFQVPHDTKKG